MKFARANFMTPVPVASSYEALNAMLAERCRQRQSDRAGRRAGTIRERLAADLAALQRLPETALESCEIMAVQVSSTALVRYRGNDYSVPTAHGFQAVVVKGFVEAVVIQCDGVPIARHARSYGHGEFVYDPMHYLALLATKPGALEKAAALQGWALPPAFQHLRHLLEARMGNRGKREFIQVLRLLEIAAIGFDAVRQIVLARVQRRPARLDLTAYPWLPGTEVRMTRAADYAALAQEQAA